MKVVVEIFIDSRHIDSMCLVGVLILRYLDTLEF